MPNDFKKKMPSKNEQMLYDLAMHVQDIDYRVYSVSSHVLALGIILGIDPKKLAEALTGDSAKMKEYSKKINEEIQKIEEKNKAEGKDSDHGHSHAHEH